MHPILCLYIDRLKGGKQEEIAGQFSPQELNIDELLHFTAPIKVEGKGYVAEDELLFSFSLRTELQLPCVICNEPVKKEVVVENVYKAFPIEEIRGGVCDLVEAIREELLLNLPTFAECEEGECPSRHELKRFLKAEGESDVYRPFENLEKENQNGSTT